MFLVYKNTKDLVTPGDKIVVNGFKCVIVSVYHPEQFDEEEKCVTVERDVRITKTRRALYPKSIGAEWIDGGSK